MGETNLTKRFRTNSNGQLKDGLYLQWDASKAVVEARGYVIESGLVVRGKATGVAGVYPLFRLEHLYRSVVQA